MDDRDRKYTPLPQFQIFFGCIEKGGGGISPGSDTVLLEDGLGSIQLEDGTGNMLVEN